MLRLIAVVFLLLATACASKLGYERKVDGRGIEEALDLSLVDFVSIDDGERVNLAAYLQERQVDFMLLMFGQRSCDICNEKLKEMHLNLVDVHPAFQLQDKPRFEAIGVSVDPFSSLGLVRNYKNRENFELLRWNDSGGELLRTYFLSEGSEGSVPFTVLVSKEGIVWRIPASAKATPKDLLDRVVATIGEPQPNKPGPSVPQPTPEPTPQPSPSPHAPNPTPIGEVSDRLKGIELTSCDSGDVVLLEERLSHADLKVVQIAPQGCEADCAENLQLLTALEERCLTSGVGEFSACRVVTIVPSRGESCPASQYAGADSLLQRFASHFDWAHQRSEGDNYTVDLPPFTKPVVLAFDGSGDLVYSAEGTLPAGFDGNLTSDSIARGPDFRLHGKTEGEVGFASIRQKAEFTVLLTFGQFCLDCRKKLSKWSNGDPDAPAEVAKPLFDYCQESGGKCQLIAMETGLPGDDVPLGSYINEVEEAISDTGNRLPLYIDPVPYGEDFSGYLQRFFDGYIAAKFPQWNGLFGVLIYSKDGLIVDSYATTEELGNQPIIYRRVKELVEGL